MRSVERLSRVLIGGALAATAATVSAKGMVLGVATHFDQGWPIGLLQQVKDAHARSIRDDVPWGKGEPKPGSYDFSDARLGFVRRACADGGDALLVVDPRHPRYDGGDTAHSPAAQQAFGAYLVQLVDHLPKGCVAGIEVGNEINADQGMKLPAGVDRTKNYVALLRAVRAALKPRHPEVAIVGASTNVIGTGFIESVAAAGGLEAMDAVAIHPYRGFADGVDLELDRVKAAMARHGGAKPIWATEFGNYFDDPAKAPPLLVKMATMLAAAGVPRAYWYALVDESYFPNMGLYDPKTQPKPALGAFRLAVDQLLAGGDPVRVDAGDRRTFVYRLASGGTVLWGDPRPLRVTGAVAARDAAGSPVAIPTALADAPIVLPPGARFTLGESPVLADSRSEFGRSPWQYLAKTADAAPVPLAMRDWQWTSYYGKAGLDPLAINADTLTPAGDGRGPTRAVLRYTAPAAIDAQLVGCFTKKNAGDGDDVSILIAGKPMYRQVVTERTLAAGVPVKLASGQTMDVVVGPNQQGGDDWLSYRIWLVRPGVAFSPACGA